MNTDTSATVNYEDHLLLFPSFYRHLSQKDPKTGRPGPYGVGNDGLLDVRMLHGGSVSRGELFDVEYGRLNYRTAARTLFHGPYLAHFCSFFRRSFAVFSVLTPGIRSVAPKDRGPVP